MSDDEFGSDIEFTQELEDVLTAAETQPDKVHVSEPIPDIEEIEDLIRQSPMEEFRKKGYLSVSDLVGTVWCEVQYDYRLRTLPYLPAHKRPEVITSKTGKEIVVNKVKVEDKERILKRGQVIHERLEREIHPEEIMVVTETREDVWGLRFITMLSGMQSLLDLGMCREMPVVGFINGVLILGIIDEITRQPILVAEKKAGSEQLDITQTSLRSFFSPMKPKPMPPPIPKRTHKVKISDSKTRASGTLPREADTTAGQLQVMLYKELFDAMISPDTGQAEYGVDELSNVTMSFERVFQHLGLSPTEPFSEAFIRQSRPIVAGNMLRYETGNARCLSDMVRVWRRYVEALGLGEASLKEGDGKSEDHLELVYRRAGGRKKGKGQGKSGRKRSRLGQIDQSQGVVVEDLEDRELQLAIELSLQANNSVTSNLDATAISSPGDAVLPSVAEEAVSFLHPPESKPMTEEEREKEEDAIALEIEQAYRQTGEIQDAGEAIPIRASQDPTSPSKEPMDIDNPVGMLEEEGDDDDPKSGAIIGRHRFKYDARLLKIHLENVMSYWTGVRQPSGVDVHNTRRCGWCEFEDGCEWRLQKAEEAMAKMKLKRQQ